jgi:hypothetical protein
MANEGTEVDQTQVTRSHEKAVVEKQQKTMEEQILPHNNLTLVFLALMITTFLVRTTTWLRIMNN